MKLTNDEQITLTGDGMYRYNTDCGADRVWQMMFYFILEKEVCFPVMIGLSISEQPNSGW